MRRTVLPVVLAAAATLLIGGAAWAATLAFAPAKNHPTGEAPRAVSAADLDGDRDTDLVTADYRAGTVSVLVRRTDGTFRAPRAYAMGDYTQGVIAREDLDGDGDRDLATVGSGVSVRLGRGDGTFGDRRKYAAGPGGALAIEAGDMDGDGDTDLVTANRGGDHVDGRPVHDPPGTVSVFLNSGSGTFQPSREFVAGEAFSPRDIDRGDFDGDGDEDLVVAQTRYSEVAEVYEGALAVLENDGNGAFGAPERYGIGPASAAEDVLAADLDGDGDNDLAGTDALGDSVVVYRNEGDGAFAFVDSYRLAGGADSPPASLPRDLTEADFDRDGDTDLATANARTDNVSVLTNAGDGTFGPDGSAQIFGAGNGPVGITRARMNGDRIPDLVTANQASYNVSVLRNTTTLP